MRNEFKYDVVEIKLGKNYLLSKFMLNLYFLEPTWDRNKGYIQHIFDEIIKIFVTIVALKLILVFVNLFFTEKPLLIHSMEIAAHIGILLIFTIDIVFDVYMNMKKRFKEVK